MKKSLGLLALIIVALIALAAPAGAWTGDTTVTGAASCDTTLVTWTVHVHTPSNYTGHPVVLVSISGLARGTELYDGFTYQGLPPVTQLYVNYPGKNGDLSVYRITNTAVVTPATCETTTTTTEVTTSTTTTSPPSTTTTESPSTTTTSVPDATTTTLPVTSTTIQQTTTSTVPRSTTSVPVSPTTRASTTTLSLPPTSIKPPSTPTSGASPHGLAFTGGNQPWLLALGALVLLIGIVLTQHERIEMFFVRRRHSGGRL